MIISPDSRPAAISGFAEYRRAGHFLTSCSHISNFNLAIILAIPAILAILAALDDSGGCFITTDRLTAVFLNARYLLEPENLHYQTAPALAPLLFRH